MRTFLVECDLSATQVVRQLVAGRPDLESGINRKKRSKSCQPMPNP
jgi:hypothetical protein